MNLPKLEVYLEKISHLVAGIKAAGGNASAIERDLLLDYTRAFYDAALNEEKPTAPKVVVSVPPPPPPPPAPKPEPKVETKKPVISYTQEPTPEENPEPEVKITPKIKVVTPPPPPPPIKEEIEIKPIEVVTPPPPPAPKPQPPRPVPANIDKEALEELFHLEEVKDLAQKLAQSPIPNLKKALSINDRILLTNELFDGDTALFEKTIAELDAMGDINIAREFLTVNFVGQYQWLEGESRSAARFLVKLLGRRYAK